MISNISIYGICGRGQITAPGDSSTLFKKCVSFLKSPVLVSEG